MLSIGKVSSGQGGYYLSEVAHGAEDYYTERGEVPGRWMGRGAALLGLAGEVNDGDFLAVLAGEDPATGGRLTAPNRRRAGFDLTFSAPKSVSVLWAFASPELREAVEAAHDAAVDAAVGYLETEAVRSRLERNGRVQVVGFGLVASGFRHRTSRTGDPQVHTHVVVANQTSLGDGRWRTLDGRWLFGHARTAGYLYQAELRWQLASRCGAEWGPVADGCAELTGIDPRVLREFSRRRAQVLAGARGSSPRARQIAALDTRVAKPDLSFAELEADWRQRADRLGLDPTQLNRRHCLSRTPAEPPVLALDPSVVGTELVARNSTFARRDLLGVLASQADRGASVASIVAAAERFLVRPEVVGVTGDRYGARYTTREQIAIETALVARAARSQRRGVGRCSELPPLPASLSGEQMEMVDRLTLDGDGVSVVVGVAGAGKTFALATASARWQANGYRVTGTALAARAARGLGEDADIPALTLHRLLLQLDNRRRQLDQRDVIVVDEAGMIGTRSLARLLDHADSARAKVVLVGDTRQLPEIDAGGAFAALARALSRVRLVENRRQVDLEHRQAIAAFRDGDIATLLGWYNRLGDLRSYPDPEAAIGGTVAEWHASRRAGRGTLMIALHRTEVRELNDAARAGLRLDGQITGLDHEIAGQLFAQGDRVMVMRNQPGAVNGDVGTVIRIDGECVEVVLDTGRTQRFESDAIESGDLAPAYAVTIHKAQGRTYDDVHVLGGTELYNQAGYTAFTRARHTTTLHWTDAPEPWMPTEPEAAEGAPVIDLDLLDFLTRTLERDRSKTLAIDHSPDRSAGADIGW